MDAIALTLPAHLSGNTTLGMMMGGGNTLSTANLDSQNVSGAQGISGVGANQSSQHINAQNQFRYDDHLIKELAFDLGVAQGLLKDQLQVLFSSK